MTEYDPIPALKRAVAEQIVAHMHGHGAGIVAAHMKTDWRRVADLRAGRLERMSLERLIRFLERLGTRTRVEFGPRPPIDREP